MSEPTCTTGDGRRVFSRGFCRACYLADLADRKASGASVAQGIERTLPRVECFHAGCKREVVVVERRRPAYEAGRPLYCSTEHRKANVQAKATYQCGEPGCTETIQRYKSEVERQATGVVYCSTHRVRGGRKPKKGIYKPCPTDGKPVYYKPGEIDGPAKFCNRRCWGKSIQGERVERELRICAYERCGVEWRLTPDQRRLDARYHTPECASAARRRQPGDRYVDPNSGYVSLWVIDPDDPDGPALRVLEHRYVMEQDKGRPLLPTETVHHKTGGFKGRSNNSIDNLELWTGRHPKGHRVEDVVKYAREMLAFYGEVDEQRRYAMHVDAVRSDVGNMEGGEADDAA